MNSYESLLARVRQVRRRWRFQVLVNGISLFLASAIALLILGVWGADVFGFRPAAVWVMRLLTGATVFFVGWHFLCAPLRARVSNVRIAQYIEENYPQMEDRLVTAMEFGSPDTTASGMIDLLIKDALDNASRVDLSVFLDRKRLLSFGSLGIAACLALFVLLNWGPSFFPYGFSHLYVPWTEASLGSSMMIKITPGDIEIAKGSDQQLRAQLVGFDSPEVRLYVQPEESNSWSSSPMEPDPRGSTFQYLLIDVRSSLRYYVESKGVQSRIYSVKVLDLARVETIDLTYNFPAYTRMAPQAVQNEGDISALKGTKVDLKIHLNRPAESARLLFDNQSTLDLARSGLQDFTGNFSLQRSGSYLVQITESRGKKYPGSPEYEIEALEDSAPKVTVTRPMRDVRATSVEEVFSEIKAEDDIGMGKLELHYSVNGGPEKVVNLYDGKPPQPAVTASHTFFLEEFGLQPGDVISYYGKGWDNNNVTGPGVASSDIYFIQIRPFEQKYTQNQQGGMQGGDGEREEALSKQQKDIISATFKVIRDQGKMPAKEVLDGLKSLALVQSRLAGQAQNLVDRMQRRGAAQVDESFRKLSDYLKNAIGDMGAAAVDLGAQKPETAMPQEQKSLQQLMRAESLFKEIQVSFSNQSSSGGGSQASAEDLADLFELEMNKLKNQYETVERGEQQSRDQKVDEALEKLKELAKRQQQLNERRLAQGRAPSSSSGASGSQSQQQLMQEAEQLKRQLQRLSRERSSPQLNEASSQLQKALEEMKKALNSSQRGVEAEAGAQGMRALQQLDDAARKLARGQDSDLRQGLDQAVNESKKLVDEQKRIQEGLERLSKDEVAAGSSEAAKQMREDLVSRKTSLADRLRNLGSHIQDLSRQARKTQKEASGKLDEAAGAIQENKLPERIMSGNALIQNGYYESQIGREGSIRNSLEGLSKQLESARGSIGQTKEGKLEEAANRARQLSEGLESMQQRLSQAQRGPGDRSGRQPGQQGRGQNQQGQSQSTQGQPGGQMQNGQTARGMAQPNTRDGRPSSDADARNLSGDPSGVPAGIGIQRNEQERQLNRELQQRLADAQELRPLLDRNSTQLQNLDRVIESLRRAGDFVKDSNPEQVARLKSAIDYMRIVEFDLARDLERLNQTEKYFFAEDNEVPGNYQKLVEEYYKSIAKSK